MSGIEVLIEDPSTHPSCVHGPTLLFSREIDGHKRFYYACSACRDRKKCSFFVWKDELEKYVNKKINKQIVEHQKSINHRSLFLKLNKVKAVPENQRIYCNTCETLDIVDASHKDHDIKSGVTDYELEHPSEFLTPLEDSKKEAQYLFSKKCVKSIIEMLEHLGKKNIICIGTPRIFEYINSDISLGMNAILLEFDSRYHSFFGPLQFSWFNLFNNHFFKEEGRAVFKDFLKSTNVSDTILITDPPFGGRVEPIADTLSKLNDEFKRVHKTDQDLPMFWIFPYFMEPYILNWMEDFSMLDYKVDYENHPLFQKGKGARKFGSPVRIFTNLEPSSITLPVEEGYKYCSICEKWVSEENKHCDDCGACTSKDGRTYNHCIICEKCVKPTWKHCKNCNKCTNETHKCEEIPFTKTCLHCKQQGHKKINCPSLDQKEETKKRKLKVKMKNKTKKLKK
ncbi:rRNA N6-adenosine-methyltransferase ZCCHC4 [Coccinella septempunctata]|uniref:rRNA N6-adenosine-methyltransferase ZCCHC4 n=1 Tax=Coccinella septempunctata TaxID=41139 RepID=UPI001D07E546|nr:rRNA N6-adenosine-methyltransferase ZCCHC4 [Coccinella septempunctata]